MSKPQKIAPYLTGFPKSLHKRFRAACKKRGVLLGFQMAKLMKDWTEEQEKNPTNG